MKYQLKELLSKFIFFYYLNPFKILCHKLFKLSFFSLWKRKRIILESALRYCINNVEKIPCGIVTKVLDCNLEVSKFKFQSSLLDK